MLFSDSVAQNYPKSVGITKTPYKKYFFVTQCYYYCLLLFAASVEFQRYVTKDIWSHNSISFTVSSHRCNERYGKLKKKLKTRFSVKSKPL